MRIITWPEGVSAETGVGVTVLKERRAAGDCPTLYAVTERRLVTTDVDLAKWVQAKVVPAGYKCRAPTMKKAS